MTISREWATPLTIGSFAIMGVTGMLMFFHFDTGLNKTVHEWAGWIMIMAVTAHVIVNWKPFARYFLASNVGRSIIGAGVLALAASFISLPTASNSGGPPPVRAMRAVAHAPIAAVAPITGRSAAQIMEDLAKAGITLPNTEASLDSVIGDNRELQFKAMAVLFSGAEQ